MPGKHLQEKINEDWDMRLNERKPSIQFIASFKENWQTLVPLFEQISSHNAVFISIYNTITRRFIYVVDEKKVGGYDAASYLAEDGFEFTISKMHPDYLQALLLLQEKALNYLFEHIKHNNRDKIIANMEGVYKRYTGEYFHFLQQTVCLETDDEGAPVLFLAYVHNITYLKKNKTCNLVITAPNEIKWWNFNFDKNCVEPVQPLSKQEKKVLSLLAEGKSSKEIANALFVSSHTVDTHRRHLLEKTNCIDTTGMITYAKLVGLL